MSTEETAKDTLQIHGLRYQTADVARAVAFYTQVLGFKVEVQKLPEFAAVTLGSLHVFLSGPGSSGSRPMPNGDRQHPGGWTRLVLRVADLASWIKTLEAAGARFRNKMETGPAGSQIQIEDPDGNPIELFQPAQHK